MKPKRATLYEMKAQLSYSSHFGINDKKEFNPYPANVDNMASSYQC
jgi:hypothetical protein